MPRLALSLSTLAQFDFGKAHIAFQEELKRVVKDILDRPGDQAARTVDLKVSIVPVMQQDGDVVDAGVEFKVSSKVPPRTTASRPTMIDRQGRLIFSEDAPDNPRQLGIEDTGDIPADSGE